MDAKEWVEEAARRRKAGDDRAGVVGVACPTCWKIIPGNVETARCFFTQVCKCGSSVEDEDGLHEAVFEAHGLESLMSQFGWTKRVSFD